MVHNIFVELLRRLYTHLTLQKEEDSSFDEVCIQTLSPSPWKPLILWAPLTEQPVNEHTCAHAHTDRKAINEVAVYTFDSGTALTEVYIVHSTLLYNLHMVVLLRHTSISHH